MVEEPKDWMPVPKPETAKLPPEYVVTPPKGGADLRVVPGAKELFREYTKPGPETRTCTGTLEAMSSAMTEAGPLEVKAVSMKPFPMDALGASSSTCLRTRVGLAPATRRNGPKRCSPSILIMRMLKAPVTLLEEPPPLSQGSASN